MLLLMILACSSNPYDQIHAVDPGTDDTGAPSGDTGVDGSPPAITLFEARPGTAAVGVDFTADDPDADLTGGHLAVEVGEVAHTFSIPDEVGWDGQTGRVSVPIGVGACAEAAVTVSGQLVDATGLESLVASATATATGTGLRTLEVGDGGTDVDHLGQVSPPAVLCGHAREGGNDGDADYTGDYDFVRIDVPADGTWTLALTWETAGDDYDLHVYGSDGTLLAWSEKDGDRQPESVSGVPVVAGEHVYVGVGAWTGAGGAWTVTIDQVTAD